MESSGRTARVVEKAAVRPVPVACDTRLLLGA